MGCSRCILTGFCLLFFYTSYGQQLPYEWGFYHAEFPKKSSFFGDYYHSTGNQMPYSGLGLFSLHPQSLQIPKTLLHLYSKSADPTHNELFPPAILRLQSAFAQQTDRTLHLPSSIEFRSGIIDDPLGKEEHIASIKSMEMMGNPFDTKMFSVHGNKPRGLDFRIQKTDMLGTEKDGDISVMCMLTAHHSSIAAGSSRNNWLPRIGIGNDVPKEMLHIGRKLTFHSGGSSRIADNLFYDINNDCNRRIDPGPGAAISMYKGSISLGISSNPDNFSEPVSFEWGNLQTFRGMIIQQDGNIGIGQKFPESTVDIVSSHQTQGQSVLRIRNNQWNTLFDIKNNGFLGINNQSPKDHLHIGKQFTLHSGTTSFLAENAYIDTDTLKNIDAGNSGFIRFQNGQIILANSVHNTIAHSSIDILRNKENSYSLRGISIDPEQAFIGIGTVLPKASLHILSVSNDSMSAALKVSSQSDNPLLTVLDNGKVGIGTAQPEQSLHILGNVQIGKQKNLGQLCQDSTYNLSVDGAIITKELIITSESWADTVFSKNYSLMEPLELENFINQYHHLPNIPKESDITQHGIHIGSMHIALLKKIEELTLYIIALHKKQGQLEELLSTNKH